MDSPGVCAVLVHQRPRSIAKLIAFLSLMFPSGVGPPKSGPIVVEGEIQDGRRRIREVPAGRAPSDTEPVAELGVSRGWDVARVGSAAVDVELDGLQREPDVDLDAADTVRSRPAVVPVPLEDDPPVLRPLLDEVRAGADDRSTDPVDHVGSVRRDGHEERHRGGGGGSPGGFLSRIPQAEVSRLSER